jgi:hypothetical protein
LHRGASGGIMLEAFAFPVKVGGDTSVLQTYYHYLQIASNASWNGRNEHG